MLHKFIYWNAWIFFFYYFIWSTCQQVARSREAKTQNQRLARHNIFLPVPAAAVRAKTTNPINQQNEFDQPHAIKHLSISNAIVALPDRRQILPQATSPERNSASNEQRTQKQTKKRVLKIIYCKYMAHIMCTCGCGNRAICRISCSFIRTMRCAIFGLRLIMVQCNKLQLKLYASIAMFLRYLIGKSAAKRPKIKMHRSLGAFNRLLLLLHRSPSILQIWKWCQLRKHQCMQHACYDIVEVEHCSANTSSNWWSKNNFVCL